jgi:hypothetical protein
MAVAKKASATISQNSVFTWPERHIWQMKEGLRWSRSP